MKRSIIAGLLAALTIGACTNFYSDNGGGGGEPQLPENENKTYVAVTGISGVPNEAITNVPLDLSVAIVEPANASNKVITWEFVGGSGVIDGAKVTADVAAEITIRAVIINGEGLGKSFTQDFRITVTDPPQGTFTVTFYANGGLFPGDEDLFRDYVSDDGSTAVARPSDDPARDHYTFKDWYTSASEGSQWNFGDPITGSTDIYAQWEAAPYSITYHLDGGTNHGGNPDDYTVESADITLQAPTKNGYAFGGWFDNDTFSGGAVTQIAAGSFGDKEFHAKWTPASYSISYTLNGGANHAGNPASYTIESGTIALQAPTRTGAVFAGWYADGGFSGGAITEIPAGSTGNKTLYAKWDLTAYTITYHLDGGTNHSGNPANYTVASGLITLQAPTKASATFGGWYDNGGFSGSAITQIAAGSTGNKTFYAKWTAVVLTPNPGDQTVDNVSGIDIPFRYVPPTAGIGASGFLWDASKYAIITYGYWMAETEVTQELYKAVFPDAPAGVFNFTSNPASGEIQEKRPAEYLIFYQAIAFCNKLSALAGKTPAYTVSGAGSWATLAHSAIPTSNNAAWNSATVNPAANGYRLPGQMEWLWAAMGATEGSHSSYPVVDYGYRKRYAGSAEGTGTSQAANHAWYTSNASSKTHEVAKKTVNELDIYDMTGNVAEYVWAENANLPSATSVTDFLPTSVGTWPGYMGKSYADGIANLNAVTDTSNKYTKRAYIGIRVLRKQD
jgi:uncharacterized repeat protein (TIGR02543 family)